MKTNNLLISSHVAIIPDGNRRWARKKSLQSWDGHEAGAKRIEKIVKQALELGVKYLTFWGSSASNLQKRPLIEKRELLRIYEQYFKKLIGSEDIYTNEVQINVLGKWKKQFPSSLVEVISEGVEKTKKHSKQFLTFLLAYSGDDDIMYAVRKIINKMSEKKESLAITKEEFGKYLMSAKLPNVDLLIRTGVENDPHNSAGFLMWQTQNSQYYFSNSMFPDFSTKEFKKTIVDFLKKERRMGQ